MRMSFVTSCSPSGRTISEVLSGTPSCACWPSYMASLIGNNSRRRERNDILQTFVWAQTNSVERWGSTPWKNGADFAAWQKFKQASERHLDSFASFLAIFKPKVAIIFNWTVRPEYWDIPLEWEAIGDHVNYTFEPTHGTHVFHTAHPTFLRGGRRASVFRNHLRSVEGR